MRRSFNVKMSFQPSVSFVRIVLLGLFLAAAGCNRPGANAPGANAPAAADLEAAAALVGQYRNVKGTWRFQANGRFSFTGGTTVQANLTYVDVPRTEVLQGTYEVRGTKLHFTLKQRPPNEREMAYQLEGRKLTIDGSVYERQ